MKNDILPLSSVLSGTSVIVVSISGGRGVRMKLAGMGLSEGMRIRVLNARRSGPCVILVGNTRLALGWGMAKRLLVREEDGLWQKG